MKTILKSITVLLTLVFLSSCSTQNISNSPAVAELLEKGEFTFMAERANPSNLDVVNVMNSIPGGSSSRILNLDSGYTIEIRKDELQVTLPYFGRMYTASMDPSKNSYRFTSKDFSVKRSEGKKGRSIFTIIANDQQNIGSINMEVFKNGKAYVSIDSNDRQPISYDGYIMENAVLKK